MLVIANNHLRAQGLPQILELADLNATSGVSGVVINGISEQDYAGESISNIGDFNNDGFDDIAIGSRAGTNGEYSGQVYIIFGNDTLPDRIELNALNNLSSPFGTAGITFNGISAFDVANVVSGIGDFDNDGISDIIIGAPGSDSNGDNSGQCFVIFGSDSPFPKTVELSELNDPLGVRGIVIHGVDAEDLTCNSVHSAGDLNNDSVDDLIIGAEDADPDNIPSGRSFVLFGTAGDAPAMIELRDLNASPTVGVAGIKLNGNDFNEDSGYSVGDAGDINGDGINEIIIGARAADPNGRSSGRSYVIFGRSSGFPSVIELRLLNTSAGEDGMIFNGISEDDLSGQVVNGLGDINSDGFDDFGIGTRNPGQFGEPTGQSYVILGSSNIVPGEFELSNLGSGSVPPGIIINGNITIGGSFTAQTHINAAGDINADGIDDFVIGASNGNPNGTNSGQSHVLFGRSEGFQGVINLSELESDPNIDGMIINGKSAGDRSGFNVSYAGDINGDGTSDLMISSYLASPNGTRSGQVYIVYGTETPDFLDGFESAIN